MVKMDKRRRHGHRGCLKNVVLSQANIPALSRAVDGVCHAILSC